MLTRLGTLLLLAMAPSAAIGATESGSYLFLHSKIIGCGEKTFLVDYTQVPDDGNVTFLDKYEINAIGKSSEEIASQLARMIGADTGSAPKTISIQVMPESEAKDVAKDLEGLPLPLPECRRPRQPHSPRPDLEQIRGLAALRDGRPAASGRKQPVNNVRMRPLKRPLLVKADTPPMASKTTSNLGTSQN